MNLSYCRFRNTLTALIECWAALENDECAEEDREARYLLLVLCAQLVKEHCDERGIPGFPKN